MTYLTVIMGYLLAMCVFGFYMTRRKLKTDEDFTVAGRRLPLLVMIGTLLATWLGSGTIIGGANFIYTYGLYASIFFLIGGPIGFLVLWSFADRIRRLGKFTIPEMLEARYGRGARVIATVTIILAYMGIVSYQFKGMGYILSLSTGLSLQTATIIAAAFIILFAAMGGMISVAYTDFVSAFFMIGGFLIVLPAAFRLAGGWSEMIAALPASHLSATGGLTWIQMFGFLLPTLFLIMGDQNIYQRFSAAKDSRVAKQSALGFLGAMIIVGPMLLFGALLSRAMWPGIEADTALMVLAMETLPVVLGGLVLSGLMAFIVTTGDSYLLSCASSFTYDLYVRVIKSPVSPQKLIWVNRAAVVVIGVLAYVLVSYFPSVLHIQMFSYAMYGAAITPSILAAFLWKRATAAACVSSMAVGALATLVWELFLNRPGDLNSIVFALPLSLLTLAAVSLLTRPVPDQKLDAFFSS